MAFTLPPLPYDYAALEPHIDEQTMRIHHDKHHAAYVNNLNAALEGETALAGAVDRTVAGDLARCRKRSARPCATTAAGTTTTRMFWELMTPGGAKAPDGAWRRRSTRHSAVSTHSRSSSPRRASTRFGSGWGWLDAQGRREARH